MPVTIGCVSQKGGVGKSSIARVIATVFATNDWRVLIADMDNKQMTSVEWVALRNEQKVTPEIAAMPCRRVGGVQTTGYDMVIYDGKPHADEDTRDIARAADLVVIPTGLSRDDLRPAVKLGHELVRAGVPASKLVYVLNHTGTDAEISDARTYIADAGYTVAAGDVPERAGFREAQNQGLSFIEARYVSLKVKVDVVAQSIADRINALVEERS